MPRKKVTSEELQEQLPTYPDLSGPVRRLQVRRTEVSEKTQTLIDKWIEQLSQIQLEMNRLVKIEQLEDALRKQKK